MTAEEIHLNDALEKAGFEVVESDLGEYIVQLRQEPPYHIVFPAMHLTRQQISDLFHDRLGSEPTNNPEDLTMIARRVMRRKYCEADMGISGANFAIAETGMISITENEGNARLTTSLPKIHVALVGIEKVLPKLSDLALFLPMLATAGAGPAHHLLQHALWRAATAGRTRRSGGISRRAAGQPPHGTAGGRRTARRAALHPLRRLLECVPDLQKRRRPQLRHHVSGPDWLGHHSASARASGLETFVAGLVLVRRLHRNLSRSKSICTIICCTTGAMRCARVRPAWKNCIQAGFVFMMCRPRLYQFAARLGRIAQPLQRLVRGTILDPLRAWTKTRSFPPLAEKSFRELWRERKTP